MNSESKQLCGILEALLAGDIDCGIAQEQVEKLAMTEFGDLYGNLHHYRMDEDIRERDPEYRAFQETELRKLIEYLKAGDVKKASWVFFYMWHKAFNQSTQCAPSGPGRSAPPVLAVMCVY